MSVSAHASLGVKRTGSTAAEDSSPESTAAVLFSYFLVFLAMLPAPFLGAASAFGWRFLLFVGVSFGLDALACRVVPFRIRYYKV